MKKRMILSLICLAAPFAIVSLAYLAITTLALNWALMLVVFWSAIFLVAALSFASLMMNVVVIKRYGCDFGGFCVFMLSIAELVLSCYCIYQIFFAR